MPLTYLEHLHPTPANVVQILLLSLVLMVHFAVVILTPLKAFFLPWIWTVTKQVPWPFQHMSVK